MAAIATGGADGCSPQWPWPTAALIGTTISLVASSAQADQTTQGIDNLRTNWDQNEAGLSRLLSQSSAFGRLFATKLDGRI